MTPDDFSQASEDGWNELLRKGYINEYGEILLKYTGLSTEFLRDLIPFDNAQIEEIAAVLSAHTADGVVAKDDFAAAGLDAELVWNELVARGYIDPDGTILSSYQGLDDAFRNSLRPLDEAAVQQISGILDDRLPLLKKLFAVTYKPGSGRVHTVKYDRDLVIVRQTVQLMELILTDQIAPSIPPSPYPGYVYIDTADFEPHSGELEEYEYVPAWSSSDEWEYIHASEFLGTAYEALPPDSRPDFWLKIQVGGKEDIEKSAYVSEDAATYEDIGDTRLSTEVIFHQIGWYNPSTGEGRLDPREQLTNADDDREQNFQTGVKRPGEDWEPWYVYEYVTGERQVTLTDGRVDAYTDGFDGSEADDNGIPEWVYAQRPTADDPDGQLNPNLETHLIEGYYVLIPVTADGGAHHDMDTSASGWIGN